MSTLVVYDLAMAKTKWGLTEQELAAWRTFAEMAEVLRGRLEQYLQADSGLSNADYTVLVALIEAPDGRWRAHELGEGLGWEKSRLHHQLTRMGARGLVERSSGEGRSSYAAITDAGRSALRAAAPAHLAHVRDLVVDPLTPEQVDQIGVISGAILARLARIATP